MYWICGPCKNNRHDLCLRDSHSQRGTNIKIPCWCSSQSTHDACIQELSRAGLTFRRRRRNPIDSRTAIGCSDYLCKPEKF